MVYNFFYKKTSNANKEMGINSGIVSEKKLKNFANQLLENLKNKKYIHIDNNWGANLADIQLLSKFNKGIPFYVLLIFLVNMLVLFL